MGWFTWARQPAGDPWLRFEKAALNDAVLYRAAYMVRTGQATREQALIEVALLMARDLAIVRQRDLDQLQNRQPDSALLVCRCGAAHDLRKLPKGPVL